MRLRSTPRAPRWCWRSSRHWLVKLSSTSVARSTRSRRIGLPPGRWRCATDGSWRSGRRDECRAALGGDCRRDRSPRSGAAARLHRYPPPSHHDGLLRDERGPERRGLASASCRRGCAKRRSGVRKESGLVGLRFGDEAMEELRLPTRHDLDTACGDRPVLVLRHDGHMVIGNTRAIEAAGITRASQAPAGGQIDREADGTPAGPFRENAVTLLLNAMPAPDLEQLRSGARSAFGRLTRYGVTSAGIILQTDEEGPAGAAGALEVAGNADSPAGDADLDLRLPDQRRRGEDPRGQGDAAPRSPGAVAG